MSFLFPFGAADNYRGFYISINDITSKLGMIPRGPNFIMLTAFITIICNTSI